MIDYMYISLDIETMNPSLKGLSFASPEGWTTSWVCIYDSVKDKVYSFVKNPDYIRSFYTGNIHQVLQDLYSFEDLKVFFTAWYKQGYTLITHNGNTFDMPILCKSITEGGADLQDIYDLFVKDSKVVDTCEYLRIITGRRFSLQNLIKGVLGDSESKLMDGGNAPIEWLNKNYLKVLVYCIGDAVYTYQVYNTVKENGGVLTAKYKQNKKLIETTVKDIDW